MTFSGRAGSRRRWRSSSSRPDGSREPFVVGHRRTRRRWRSIPTGRLHVSSRFDGSVHRVDADGRVTTVATDLGVACGIAFRRDGTLYVGDRSGSILRVARRAARRSFASIPPSVAAFHLAFGPDGWLYVTAPTLGARDCVYRISPDGLVEVFYDGFGRPQGLAFDRQGDLYVVDALAGASGVYRMRLDRRSEAGAGRRGRLAASASRSIRAAASCSPRATRCSSCRSPLRTARRAKRLIPRFRRIVCTAHDRLAARPCINCFAASPSPS